MHDGMAILTYSKQARTWGRRDGMLPALWYRNTFPGSFLVLMLGSGGSFLIHVWT